MKHYYPFLLILILSISKSYSQIDRKLINDWKYQAKKGDSVFLKNNKNLALGYYKKAKKISFLINEYPAPIITYSRIQSVSTQMESDSLLNKVINYIDITYKDYNKLKTVIKDSIKTGGLNYYYQILFKNIVKQNKNILPAIKELAFIEGFGNHDLNSFYFYQKWEELDTTSIKNYSIEYMNVAIKSGHISYNDKKYEDALIYYKKAIDLLRQNSDLKSVFFEDLYMSIFNTYLALNDCKGFSTYEESLTDYYSEVYGKNSIKEAYINNELGVCNNNNATINNHLKLAKNYFGIALNQYLMSNEIESKDYKVTKENYLSLIEADNKFKKKLKITYDELAVYTRLKVRSVNYINSLNEYIFFIKGDKNMVKELEEKLKDQVNYYKESKNHQEYINSLNELILILIGDENRRKELEELLLEKLNYLIKSKDYTLEYVKAFRMLGSIYMTFSETEKALELFKRNESILSELNIKYGSVYEICAQILSY